MAEEKQTKLLGVLSEQERILDSMLEEQDKVHECVARRAWDGLEEYVMNISELGHEFYEADKQRDKIARVSESIYLAPEVRDVFLRVKTKLSKSKVENDALAKYVRATKQFISRVMDDCACKQRNEIYSPNGSFRKNFAQSVVVNTSV